MNEKLNTVFDIINATNTVSANRYLSHALGAEVAIIYNALLAKYSYYSKHDMIPVRKDTEKSHSHSCKRGAYRMQT